ncbi:MAG: hypothetical protein D6705_15440, partial [Deltaproteobacteria bacterium]
RAIDLLRADLEERVTVGGETAADVAFRLAQLLEAAGPSDHDAAVARARYARDIFLQSGKQPKVEAVEAWLAEHAGPAAAHSAPP